MQRSLTAKHGSTLLGFCAVLGGAALLSATLQPAAAGSPAVPLGGIPGIGPGTGVDVYIPNPDAQPPIAWSQGTEPPPPQGDYGGGFIQYLITGNETRPRPRPEAPRPTTPRSSRRSSPRAGVRADATVPISPPMPDRRRAMARPSGPHGRAPCR